MQPRDRLVTGRACSTSGSGARVARMKAQGLVDEVERLVASGLGRTASRAVGYAEILAMLRGELSQDEAFDAIAAGTRRLALPGKQMGWFGRDPRVHWLDAQDPQAGRTGRSRWSPPATTRAKFLGLATDDPTPRRSLGS